MEASVITLPEQLNVQLGARPYDTLMGAVDALPPGAPAVLDATGLRHFDTSALAAILGLRRHCQSAGRSLQVRALPERLQGLATLYGVAELI